MVKLIAGRRGTGKTKMLINAIHEAKKKSNGNVVAIQAGSSLISEVNHKIRLINIEDYKIADTSEMFGFVGGILASDYDCTDIFVDGILKIVGGDLVKAGEMFERIERVSGDVNVTFTVSADVSALPESVKKYL